MVLEKTLESLGLQGYVEINENKCEGMVPLRDLDDDYYEFDEKNYCLLGRRHHHRYTSSVVPFSSCPQSLPASESFAMSQLFA